MKSTLESTGNKVKFLYSDMYESQVYHLMNFDKYIHLCHEPHTIREFVVGRRISLLLPVFILHVCKALCNVTFFYIVFQSFCLLRKHNTHITLRQEHNRCPICLWKAWAPHGKYISRGQVYNTIISLIPIMGEI